VVRYLLWFASWCGRSERPALRLSIPTGAGHCNASRTVLASRRRDLCPDSDAIGHPRARLRPQEAFQPAARARTADLAPGRPASWWRSVGHWPAGALDRVPDAPSPRCWRAASDTGGFWEDIAHHLTPRQRLIAAAVSGLLASAFAGGIIARLDIPVVDSWLAYPLFAVPLTCFMVMGACNAFNLIDGAHGLLGGTALLMFAGLAVAAGFVGDRLVLAQSVVVIGALAGFLFWNYPHGRVFMCDGGAYFIGFVYAQLSIQIVARNAEISAWFVIMLAAYPIVETRSITAEKSTAHALDATRPSICIRWSIIRVALPTERNWPTPTPTAPTRGRALWVHGLICCALALPFESAPARCSSAPPRSSIISSTGCSIAGRHPSCSTPKHSATRVGIKGVPCTHARVPRQQTNSDYRRRRIPGVPSL
jgi:UDP-N-acetylmuramyl pentapeptide phosphotransferase/UDP-N-acetylglucosamine-1-phosphate transferase